ncbi:DinB family protein [Shouchella patagoniensis]|uniref:DinB family protein n=1 Tax=Shouchella patagoniensis TaxID=228576 RepID=UPI000994B58F|nr:DinB family protein [Shouchella patagoniensis]
MKTFFQYNWQVRNEWYDWCEGLSEEELLAERTGGVGGILKTLFHIIDVEWSWIRLMEGKPDLMESFERYKRLREIRELDAVLHQDVKVFVEGWSDRMETNLYHDERPSGIVDTDTWGEIMRHIIAHEIHHIGQLSVWAREMGRDPISANVIGRGLARNKTHLD